MKKVLVIGYGNTTRSDDGAGVRVAEHLAGEKVPGMDVRVMQQLHIDLVEDLRGYDTAFFIDASENVQGVSLERIQGSGAAGIHSSHHLGPGVLASLGESLYQQKPDFYVCQIAAENFDFGEALSSRTETLVPEAARCIKDKIREIQYA